MRSRKVEGVKQEMWGIFLAYNLVRLQIEKVADDAGVEPTQISFAGSLRLVCDTWLRCSLPGAELDPDSIMTNAKINYTERTDPGVSRWLDGFAVLAILAPERRGAACRADRWPS